MHIGNDFKGLLIGFQSIDSYHQRGCSNIRVLGLSANEQLEMIFLKNMGKKDYLPNSIAVLMVGPSNVDGVVLFIEPTLKTTNLLNSRLIK